jgi:hypothetical protein
MNFFFFKKNNIILLNILLLLILVTIAISLVRGPKSSIITPTLLTQDEVLHDQHSNSKRKLEDGLHDPRQRKRVEVFYHRYNR